MIEYVAPAPAVTFATPAPVIEYVTPSPVIEHTAPAPSVTCFMPACTMAAVTTGVSLDTSGLANPQFPFTAVGASAPQVVDSLSPLDEFAAHVYNQVRQELFVAKR